MFPGLEALQKGRNQSFKRPLRCSDILKLSPSAPSDAKIVNKVCLGHPVCLDFVQIYLSILSAIEIGATVKISNSRSFLKD